MPFLVSFPFVFLLGFNRFLVDILDFLEVLASLSQDLGGLLFPVGAHVAKLEQLLLVEVL